MKDIKEYSYNFKNNLKTIENLDSQWFFNFDYIINPRYSYCNLCDKRDNLILIKNKITNEEIYICYDCFIKNKIEFYINNNLLNEEDREYYLAFFKNHFYINREQSVRVINNLIEKMNKDNSKRKIKTITKLSEKYSHKFFKLLFLNYYYTYHKNLSYELIDNLFNIIDGKIRFYSKFFNNLSDLYQFDLFIYRKKANIIESFAIKNEENQNNEDHNSYKIPKKIVKKTVNSNFLLKMTSLFILYLPLDISLNSYFDKEEEVIYINKVYKIVKNEIKEEDLKFVIEKIENSLNYFYNKNNDCFYRLTDYKEIN